MFNVEADIVVWLDLYPDRIVNAEWFEFPAAAVRGILKVLHVGVNGKKFVFG